MNQPFSHCMSVLSVAALVAGCATPTTSPEWDARFGDSTRVLRALQVNDPQAPTRRITMVTDGKTVAGTYKMWHEWYGYVRAEPPVVVRDGVRHLQGGGRSD
jgi:hypothetical protein